MVRFIAAPDRVTVRTVFVGSPDDDRLMRFDEASGFRSSTEAIAYRRCEDLFALSVVGTHGLHLDLCDRESEGIGSRWEFKSSMFPLGRGLFVLLSQASDLFDCAWSRSVLNGYVDLLEDLASTPDAPLEIGSCQP